MWKNLRTDPPTENKDVILFPVISDVGILYTCSNPDYARGKYALESGYTHWMYIPEHPDHNKMLKTLNEMEQ